MTCSMSGTALFRRWFYITNKKTNNPFRYWLFLLNLGLQYISHSVVLDGIDLEIKSSIVMRFILLVRKMFDVLYKSNFTILNKPFISRLLIELKCDRVDRDICKAVKARFQDRKK